MLLNLCCCCISLISSVQSIILHQGQEVEPCKLVDIVDRNFLLYKLFQRSDRQLFFKGNIKHCWWIWHKIPGFLTQSQGHVVLRRSHKRDTVGCEREVRPVFPVLLHKHCSCLQTWLWHIKTNSTKQLRLRWTCVVLIIDYLHLVCVCGSSLQQTWHIHLIYIISFHVEWVFFSMAVGPRITDMSVANGLYI